MKRRNFYILLIVLLSFGIALSACKSQKKYNPKKCKTCPHFWR